MKESEVYQLIEQKFPKALIQVTDLNGTGDHFDLRIASPLFQGKSRIQQHQMVYDALGEAMHGPIHAIKISTFAEDFPDAKS